MDSILCSARLSQLTATTTSTDGGIGESTPIVLDFSRDLQWRRTNAFPRMYVDEHQLCEDKLVYVPMNPICLVFLNLTNMDERKWWIVLKGHKDSCRGRITLGYM